VKRRCVIEEAIGETRAAVYEGRQLVELYARRWTERDNPRAGDVFGGHVRSIDPSVGGAFIDIGQAVDGLLKFTNAANAPRLNEGQYIEVDVLREGGDGKGPVLRFAKLQDGQTIKGKLSGLDLRTFISDRFPGISFEDAPVSVIDDATDVELALKGGGSIAIERTRALTAIDVDKGSAKSGFDAALAAIALLSKQIRLRGLGGLFVVDLPNLRQPRQRNAVQKAMAAAFANDPNTVKIAPFSRFGCIELSRSKPLLSLDETLNDKFGLPTTETLALRGLRRLEREGRANPGAKLTLTVPHRAMNWLESGQIDWKASLDQRLGARYTVEAGTEIDIGLDR